jgi:hypothetical protein
MSWWPYCEFGSGRGRVCHSDLPECALTPFAPLSPISFLPPFLPLQSMKRKKGGGPQSTRLPKQAFPPLAEEERQGT